MAILKDFDLLYFNYIQKSKKYCSLFFCYIYLIMNINMRQIKVSEQVKKNPHVKHVSLNIFSVSSNTT